MLLVVLIVELALLSSGYPPPQKPHGVVVGYRVLLDSDVTAVVVEVELLGKTTAAPEVVVGKALLESVVVAEVEVEVASDSSGIV